MPEVVPGDGLPNVGDVIAGPRNHWAVVEVRPIESAKYPHDWRASLRCLGPHRGVVRPWWWSYPAKTRTIEGPLGR